MKKCFLMFALLLAVGAYAQQQHSLQPIDSSKKSNTPVYALVLDSTEREQLFGIIRMADLKPSDIRGIIDFLMQKSQVLSVIPAPATTNTPGKGNPANEAKKGQNK